ncbi:MAG TPA: hypothetical protein VK928_11785 [Longimicrobiales bacterium]|nr:hypothetical protein [Longimicrobiales bacterium]
MTMIRFRTGAALAAAVLLMAACESTTPTEATFNATWAGERWRGDASASFAPGDTLWIHGSSPAGGRFPESSVSIGVPYTGPGTYTLPAGTAYVHYLIGGDVLTASYVNVADSWLVIDEVADGRVRGSVIFAAAHASGGQPVGAAATFEGFFNARLFTIPE